MFFTGQKFAGDDVQTKPRLLYGFLIFETGSEVKSQELFDASEPNLVHRLGSPSWGSGGEGSMRDLTIWWRRSK